MSLELDSSAAPQAAPQSIDDLKNNIVAIQGYINDCNNYLSSCEKSISDLEGSRSSLCSLMGEDLKLLFPDLDVSDPEAVVTTNLYIPEVALIYRRYKPELLKIAHSASKVEHKSKCAGDNLEQAFSDLQSAISSYDSFAKASGLKVPSGQSIFEAAAMTASIPQVAEGAQPTASDAVIESSVDTESPSDVAQSSSTSAIADSVSATPLSPKITKQQLIYGGGLLALLYVLLS